MAASIGLKLPSELILKDEFYNFDVDVTSVSPRFHCFAFAEHASYDVTKFEKPEWEGTHRAGVGHHPVGWFHEMEESKCRVLVLALGHLAETFALEPIRMTIAASINWAGFHMEDNSADALHKSVRAAMDVSPSMARISEIGTELAVVKTQVDHFSVAIGYDSLNDMKIMSRCIPSENASSVHFIIADSTVDALYGSQLEQSLRTACRLGDVRRLVVPDGEESKSMEMFISLADQVLKGGVDKHSAIVTLGGGMINNLGGMVAATVYRGLRLVHIGTSLLGQVDAAVGIKQAMNWKVGKNQLGALYAPSFVVLDTKTLATLPLREKVNGMGEALKHALAQDVDFLRFCLKHSADDLHDFSFLHHVVKVSASLKAQCLNSSKKSDRAEMIMQYGHALGHAIEYLSNYEMRHGEAIAIGMTLSAEIAVILGHGDPLRLEALRTLHQELFSRYGLPWQVPDAMSTGDICAILKHDKHYIDSGPTMMTLKDVGKPFIDDAEKSAIHIPYDVIEQAIRNSKARSLVLSPLVVKLE